MAAEVCRSALATWDLPVVVTPVWFHELEDFARSRQILALPAVKLLPFASERFASVEAALSPDKNRLPDRLLRQTQSDTARRAVNSHVGVLALFRTGDRARYPGRNHRSRSLRSRAWSNRRILSADRVATCRRVCVIANFDLRPASATGALSRNENATKATRGQIVKCENFVTLQTAVEKAEKLCAEEFVEWFMLFKNPRFH